MSQKYNFGYTKPLNILFGDISDSHYHSSISAGNMKVVDIKIVKHVNPEDIAGYPVIKNCNISNEDIKNV